MSEPYNPPSPFRPTSRYVNRFNPRTGELQFHAGQDFAAPEGTPIPAATPGRVIYSGFNDGYGNTVIVQTTNGYSLYAHMKHGAPRAQLGQQVWPGDLIGHVGNTGSYSRGNHLHYSIITEGKPGQANPSGGPIGLKVDRAHTADPATFDMGIRYLEQPPERSSPGTLSQGLLGLIVKHVQRRDEPVSDQTSGSVFDTGAAAIPFIPDDSEGSFVDRFGDRPPIRRLSSEFERR